mgnify:CR=1 FL=1
MEYNPRVQIIPAKPKPRNKRVAIYARVSSNSAEQLESLTIKYPDSQDLQRQTQLDYKH